MKRVARYSGIGVFSFVIEVGRVVGFVEFDAVVPGMFERAIEGAVERDIEFVTAIPFPRGAFASGVKIRLEEVSTVAVKGNGVVEEIVNAERVERIPARVIPAFDQEHRAGRTKGGRLRKRKRGANVRSENAV